jgi:hypothetical protein
MISNYYKYRIPITIDHTKIDEDLTHFPLKVVVSGTTASGIHSEIGSANKSIAFKDENDNHLYCEIEQTYDESGVSYVYHVSRSDWVISSVTDTTIYFCYDKKQLDNDDYVGYAGDTVAQNVWDSNFAAVYHMNQDPSGGTGCILDSTSNSNDGTPSGGMTSGDLVDADYGKAIDFDGVDDCINVSSDANGPLNPENITVETLLKLPSTPDGWDKVVVLGRDSSYTLQSRHSTTSYPSFRIWGSSYVEAISTAYIYDNTYHLLTGTHDGVDVKIFTDGLLSCSPATLNGAILSDPGDFRISGDPLYASANTKMLVAELRISNTSRSAAWIKATNASLTDTLSTKGETETIDIPETVEEVEWTPEYITSSLWLDADDSSTITLDGSGNVEQWDDKSGNGRNASQTNSSYRPALIVEAKNGLDIINLNSDFMDLDISLTTNDFSIFIACNPSVSTLDNTLAYFLDASGTNRITLAQLVDNSNPRNKVGFFDGDWSFMALATTGGQILNYQLTASATLLRNGTQIGTGAYTQLSIGGSVRLFSHFELYNNYAVGDIYEILILEGIPSETDRQLIEGYLAWRWGLEATLPSGHPYKSALPTTYIDKIPTYYFEGTVIDGISQYVERNIRLYRYDTGELMNTTTSISGSFFITTTYTGTHYITCHDLPYGEYNDLIFGKITPGITY